MTNRHSGQPVKFGIEKMKPDSSPVQGTIATYRLVALSTNASPMVYPGSSADSENRPGNPNPSAA
jgi:hypothetical protein